MRGTRKSARRPGRPKVWTRAAKDKVIPRLLACLETGETLQAVCKRSGMPTPQTVRHWVIEDDPAGFAARYARAREIGYEARADELLDISAALTDPANGPLTSERVQAARLHSDSVKWLLSKMLPKIYGDKIQHTGDGGGPIQIVGTLQRGRERAARVIDVTPAHPELPETQEETDPPLSD